MLVTLSLSATSVVPVIRSLVLLIKVKRDAILPYLPSRGIEVIIS